MYLKQPVDREELLRVLTPTERLQEVLFEYGGDGETFIFHKQTESIGFLLGSDEFELLEPAFVKVCRMVGVAETLLGKFPRELIVPLLNYWFKTRCGDMKTLLDVENRVVAFTKASVSYVPNVQILEAVEHALNSRFGNGMDLMYHSVYNDLAETQFAVVTPRARHTIPAEIPSYVGDVLNFGIQVQNSILGEKPVVIGAYIYRLICTNGAISCDNVFTFSRRIKAQTLPAWVEDVCLQAADKVGEEFNRINTMASTRLEQHGGHIVQNLFSEFHLPREQRETVATALLDGGAETLYDVYNSITNVANNTEATPAQVRHLQTAAGHLAAHHDFCPACHRTLTS